MKMNKMLTIPIVLIMTLAFCGIAYAHWFDQVHIEGVTKGGTVNIAFDDFEHPTYLEFHEVGGSLRPGEYLEKNVGSGNAYYDPASREEDVHTGKIGYEKMVIDIFCAYPCYRAHTTFKIHNIGTIPVNICEYIITGERTTKTDVHEYDLLFKPGATNPYEGELYEDRNDDGIIDSDDVLVINLDIINGRLPYQLDPCNTNKQEIDIHFKQDASQCHRYKIYVDIVGLQWNKDCTDFVPPPD